MQVSGRKSRDFAERLCHRTTCENESARITALKAYGVAGSARSDAFDGIAQLAADAFKAPIALVSFIDGSREWFAGAVGTHAREVALKDSLAAHTIRNADFLVLADARFDPCYQDNPLIARDQCRFYAAAPIMTQDGFAIGAISVLDTAARPAEIDARERRMLRALASQVVAQLERNRQRADLQGISIAPEGTGECPSPSVELSGEFPWIADSRFNILTLPVHWQQLSGLGIDEGLGRCWMQRVHPEDVPSLYEAMSSAGCTGALDVRFRLRVRDGAYRWMRGRAAPRYDEQGQIVRWFGATKDIHDQEVARIALDESEAHYRWGVELSAQIQWTASPEGVVEMVGSRWNELTGQGLTGDVGDDWTKFLHPDDGPRALATWANSAETGQPYDATYRVRVADGGYRWFRAQATGHRDEHGAVVRWYGTLEDIHDRKLAAQALRESEERLRLVTDAAEMGTWDYNFITGEGLCNERLQELVRLPPGDPLTPDALAAFVHPDDYPGLQAEIDAAFDPDGSGEYRVEHRVVGIDGAMRWATARGRVYFDGGKPVRFVGTLIDISAQKAAEQALRESEDHYRWSVELNPQIPWTAEPNGRVSEMGPRWEELTGTGERGISRAYLYEPCHPEDFPVLRSIWLATVSSGGQLDTECRLRMADGSYRWFRSRAAPRRDDHGNVVRWYGTIEDIHDRKSAEQALRESEERFRLAAQAAGLGIWDYDATSGTPIWSGELKSMLGLTSDKVCDMHLARTIVHPDDRHILGRFAAAASSRKPGHRFEATIRVRRADSGALRWMRTGGWMTLSDSGHLARLIITVRDITEERLAEDRVRWTAAHDSLTQLPNRASFHEQLELTIREAAQRDHKAALLILDIDHFKQINDSLGHDAGDALLCAFGNRVRSAVRTGDVVCRLGGDEFAVILRSIREDEEVAAAVDRILAGLREPVIHHGRVLECKASIGASIYPDDATDPDELLKDADIALYAAKAAGRSRFMLFKPQMRAEMQRRASMLNIAREALDEDRILPFYQPKVELSTGRISGFEALLRLHHPRYGIQRPAVISAAFEDLDLASAMSDRMFDRVIADMRLWLDAGIEFGHVAVNASAAEFRQDDLAERILDRLADASVPANRLELEVTETVFLGKGGEYVDRALKLLAHAGVRIALDDFGTGYASLSHLKQFPVHIIKIDRSFVRDIETDPEDAAIIRAVLNLGNSLGIEIVAEGIETQAQAEYLARQGCEYGQGFLFSKALPANHVAALLSEWQRDGRRFPRQGDKPTARARLSHV